MAEAWILNASPLIALDLVGCIDVLASLAGDVVIPDAVLAEVSAGPNPLSPDALGTFKRPCEPLPSFIVTTVFSHN